VTETRLTASRSGNTIVIAAAVIAAVRLAREEKWDHSPRIISRIADSVRMAYQIYAKVRTNYPELFKD
jgi:metal-dependent amidase/aminoacylase/carboxypeptidase family protein